MRYRDSDALFLPARPPEHAAPVSFLRRRRSPREPGVYGRFRRLTRQVLQLFITTVAWATGLGLVIGSIVLVATAVAPRHAVPPLSAVQRGNKDSLHQQAPSAGVSKAPGSSHGYRVLAKFSGQGNLTTRHFSVRGNLRWQLQWAYRCAPQADAKHFMLLRANIGDAQPTIRRTTENFAASGRGSAWLSADGHRHYLKVISGCSWSVKVVQAA